MFAAKIQFKPGNLSAERLSDLAYSLLASWYKNGQIVSREWTLSQDKAGFVAYVLLPESEALSEVNSNKYVSQDMLTFQKECGVSPEIALLGPHPEQDRHCVCKDSNAYILFTNYLSIAPPLRCAECFYPVPLYRMPYTSDEEYLNVLQWQGDYQACDTLQMHCTVGERFAENQLFNYESALTESGRAICKSLEMKTGKKFFYYLHKSRGKSTASEQKRLCPSCNQPWLLLVPWHDLFNFRCEKCSLLSNIACSLAY